MARQRSPNRDKAFNIYKKYNGDIKLKDIAKQLNVSDTQIRKWKSSDKWEQKLKGTLKGNGTKSNVTFDNKEISWIDIENEYVTDIRKKPCSLENLSKKYNISIQSIKDYSALHEWSKKRTEYKQKTIQKAVEKSSELISTDIAKVTAKHFKIADTLLNQLEKALQDPDDLYKIVEKLRTGYAPGEFTEEIVTKIIDTLNDKKLVNYANALTKLQAAQRQSLGIMDADIKEKLKIDKAKIKPDDDILESENDGFIEALEKTATEDWEDEHEEP